jgi:hypothetical protein
MARRSRPGSAHGAGRPAANPILPKGEIALDKTERSDLEHPIEGVTLSPGRCEHPSPNRSARRLATFFRTCPSAASHPGGHQTVLFAVVSDRFEIDHLAKPTF